MYKIPAASAAKKTAVATQRISAPYPTDEDLPESAALMAAEEAE